MPDRTIQAWPKCRCHSWRMNLSQHMLDSLFNYYKLSFRDGCTRNLNFMSYRILIFIRTGSSEEFIELLLRGKKWRSNLTMVILNPWNKYRASLFQDLIKNKKEKRMGFFKNMSHRMGIMGELLQFFLENKWWWLTPMVLVLLIFGLLIIFAQSSAVAPFIYTLF